MFEMNLLGCSLQAFVYLKRHEKEWKKRAEKEYEIRRRREEEENERKRQEKKLNFLLTQTELYAHFMAKKLCTLCLTSFHSTFLCDFSFPLI